MKKYKRKLCGLVLIDFVLSLAPLLIPVLTSWDYYTASVGRTISLGTGLTMLIIVVIMIALGKLPKNVSAIVWLVVFDVILFLIGDIITQLKWLIMAAIGGQVLSKIFTRPAIRKLQKKKSDGDMADVLVERLKESGNGIGK